MPDGRMAVDLKKTVPISDLMEPVRNRNPAATEPEDLFSYIDLSSIDQERKVVLASRSVLGRDAPSRARQQVKAGDVLVSTVRPNLNGVALLASEHDGAVASTGFCVLRPDQRRLDPSYLFHWVKTPSFIDEMVRHATGATYPAISDRIVTASQMPIYPLPEQRRIAAILDGADALRVKRRAALAQLDEMAQAIFMEMFGSPASSLQTHESLGNHLSFVTSGGRNWSRFYAAHGSRFIRSLDVQMNSIGDDEITFVEPPSNAEARRTQVRAGDVLLTITGSRIGRVTAVPTALADSFVSQHVAILRLRDTLLPQFLSYFLSLPNGGQVQIESMQYGQTKPGLNFDQIKRFQVPVPSISKQNQFVNRLGAVMHSKSLNHQHEAFLHTLFASLQHHAFTGAL